MRKILSFFTYCSSPSSISGYPLVLAETIGVFLLSILLLSLLPACTPADAPGLSLLCRQLPLTLFCPAITVLSLHCLNPGIPMSALLDLRPFSFRQFHRLQTCNFKILLWSIPLILLMNYTAEFFLHLLGFHNLPQQHFFLTEHIHSPEYCLTLLFTAVFLAPIAEELLFRHLLTNTLCVCLHLPLPQIVSAGAFALFHGIPQAVPSLFLLALILQKQKEKEGLGAAILLHGTYNLLVFILIYLQIRLISAAS